MIHVHYIENPQMVHDAIYEGGGWAYSECERLYLEGK